MSAINGTLFQIKEVPYYGNKVPLFQNKGLKKRGVGGEAKMTNWTIKLQLLGEKSEWLFLIEWCYFNICKLDYVILSFLYVLFNYYIIIYIIIFSLRRKNKRIIEEGKEEGNCKVKIGTEKRAENGRRNRVLKNIIDL